ncbi:Ig-like domain-containing protein [Lysinibacter cavernae]|uniref:Adhesin/invasin n=1 Tax=Lysinibacter cavernae TaxID=1640652 RepID=A0A7X5R116_9MICO|nr:Ig-like domain-containing protein [Lysinibacter cavernae]NIH53729.1 adhesin/invasin [Lysinibacter cavernae]
MNRPNTLGRNRRQSVWARIRAYGSLTIIGALIAAGAVTIGPAPAPAASAAVTTGVITSTNGPLNRIALNAGFNQQVWNNSIMPETGTFFPKTDANGASNSYIRVFAGASTTAATFPAGTQSFGGDGTRSNPYFIQTVSTSTASPAGITVTERLTYVEGDAFWRSDVTMRNTGATAQTLSYYRYADCTLAGQDSGVAAISATATECRGTAGNNVVIALMPITEGANLQAGHYSAIATRVLNNRGLTNTCIDSDGANLAEKCGTTSQDNAFALSYQSQVLAAGQEKTYSTLSNYASTPPAFSDLVSAVQVPTPGTIPVGYQFNYTVTVRNNGPANATNASAQLRVPTNFEYLSATPESGTYNLSTGVWDIGALASGESRLLTVTARALNQGQGSLGVLSTSSANIDNTPCVSGSTANCGSVIIVTVSGLSAAASNYRVSTGVRLADGSDPHTITVNLVAQNGDPVSGQAAGLRASAQPSAGFTIGPFTETAILGTYTAAVTSINSGYTDISVTAQIAGVDTGLVIANGAYATADFIAGDPSVGQSTVTIDDGYYRLANGDEFHSIAVVLADANQNPVSGKESLLSATAPTGAVVSEFRETATAGRYTAMVRSTLAGSLPIAVLFNSVTPIGTVNALYQAGTLDLQHPGTRIELLTSNPRIAANPSSAGLQENEIHRFKATLVDAFGNPIAHRAVTFNMTDLTLVESSVNPATTNANGEAFISVATSAAATYSVTATVDGSSLLNGSPIHPVVVPAPLWVGLGYTVLNVSSGDVEANSPNTHRLEAQARDPFGNRISGASVHFMLPAGLELAPGSQLDGVTDEFGYFVAYVKSATPGEFSVGATIDNNVVPDRTVSFTVGAPSPADSSWSITTASPQPAGSPFEATVSVRDVGGVNPVDGAEVSFVLPPNVSIVESAPYTTGADGTVTVKLLSTVAGEYVIQAALGGTAIGSTQTIEVGSAVPDLSSVHTSLVKTSSNVTAVADGVSSHSLRATVADEYGNVVIGQSVTFNLPAEVTTVGGTPTTVTTDGDGQASLSVVSLVAATHSVTATVNGFGDVQTGSPIELTFVAGAPVLANSTVTVDPAGPLTVGDGPSNTYTASIIARDANNNVVPRQQMILTSTPALVQSLPGGLTDENGELSITLTSLVAGSYTLATDIAINQEINNFAIPVVRQFVAAAPDLAADGRSTLGSTNGMLIADGENEHTLLASVRDVYGNPIVNQNVWFDLPANLATAGGEAQTVVTGLDGNASLNVVSTVAGGYAVEAYLGTDSSGSAIANGSPTTVVFGAGVTSASSSALTVTPADVPPLVAGTGAQSTYTLVAEIEDAYDNPIVGAPVTFELLTTDGEPVADQPVISDATPNTDNNGVATVTVTSTRADTFVVNARINGATGETVAGSGELLSWKPSLVTAENSVLTVTQGVKQTGAAFNHGAAVVAKDQFGNVVTDPVEVQFVVESGATGAGSVPTEDGTASTSISSNSAGTYLVSATINGDEVYPGPLPAVFADLPTQPTVHPSNGTVLSGTGQPGMTIEITLPGGVVLTATVGDDGTWSLTPPLGTPFAHGDRLIVEQVDENGFRSEPAEIIINLERPDAPVVYPSDGATITGCAEPGSTVTVRNAAGVVIGTGVVADDCSYSIVLQPRPAEGEIISVVVTDAAGNDSEPLLVRIGLATVVLEHATRTPGQTQVATGTGFQPGEAVSATLRSTPVDLGTRVADANGTVSFTFALPGSIELGAHSVTLVGPRSGSISTSFSVVAAETGGNGGLEVTGAEASVGPIAVLLAAAGIVLLTFARRRSLRP